MAAIIPAIAARSMFQCVTDATPRMSTSSDKLVIIIELPAMEFVSNENYNCYNQKCKESCNECSGF